MLGYNLAMYLIGFFVMWIIGTAVGLKEYEYEYSNSFTVFIGFLMGVMWPIIIIAVIIIEILAKISFIILFLAKKYNGWKE